MDIITKSLVIENEFLTKLECNHKRILLKMYRKYYNKKQGYVPKVTIDTLLELFSFLETIVSIARVSKFNVLPLRTILSEENCFKFSGRVIIRAYKCDNTKEKFNYLNSYNLSILYSSGYHWSTLYYYELHYLKETPENKILRDLKNEVEARKLYIKLTKNIVL